MVNGEKILVTGGAGYIGSHTVVALHQAGYHPIIVDDFSNSSLSAINGIERIIGAKVEVKELNCLNIEALDKVFADNEIKGVIHFAAFKAVGESVAQPLRYYRNNLVSLLNILELMEAHGVSRIVFSSSCTVYGEPDTLPVDEGQPMRKAESPYGNTKKMCEEIIADAVIGSEHLKAVSLRYFNPVGAHPSGHIGELPLGVPNNLVPYITQTAIGLREQLTVFGDDYNTPDGSCIRDFIHVEDLAEAHIAALRYINQPESPRQDAFNIGTGQGSSVLEVIASFERESGQKLNYSLGERRLGDIEKIYANPTKANTLLNWKTTRDLATSMRDAWNWEKSLKQKRTES